ncbi:DUF6522 family protein [Sneathiella sp.]|uniref:DUF6522 family protein n=1 Tax=Sneathiella sp. TaxID=1964365 RepID=UPI0035696F9A
MNAYSRRTEGRDILEEMVRIDSLDGDIEIDAGVVAKGLKIDVASLQAGMRNGSITSLCEQGIEKDEGQFRLTFFSNNCQYRLVVDEKGTVIQSSVINFGDRANSKLSHMTAR